MVYSSHKYTNIHNDPSWQGYPVWMPRDEYFLHLWIAQQAACIYLYTYKTCRCAPAWCTSTLSPNPKFFGQWHHWEKSLRSIRQALRTTWCPRAGHSTSLALGYRTVSDYLGMGTWRKLTLGDGWAKNKGLFSPLYLKKTALMGREGVMVTEGSLRAGRDLPPIAKGSGRGLLCLQTGLAGISRGGGWGKYLVGNITCFEGALKFQEPFSCASEMFPAWQSHRESRQGPGEESGAASCGISSNSSVGRNSEAARTGISCCTFSSEQGDIFTHINKPKHLETRQAQWHFK